MIARVVKIAVRERIRDRMRQLKVPLEQPYRKVIIDYLNQGWFGWRHFVFVCSRIQRLVFGSGELSRAYWNGELKTRIHASFSFGLSVVESEPAYDLWTSVVSAGHQCILFQRVVALNGCK